MPKRTMGPFLQLAGLPAIDVAIADDLDILERMDLVNSVLAEAGCNCNGHAAGHQRDEYWGGDLSELVYRASAHEISYVDTDGNKVIGIVSVKLDTLQVEVDGNNEICCWIYEES